MAPTSREPGELGKIERDILELWRALNSLAVEEGTIRIREVDCGRCENLHGPYVYVYKRRDGALKELYLGREYERANKIRHAMTLAKEIRALRSRRRRIIRALVAREEKWRARNPGLNVVKPHLSPLKLQALKEKLGKI